MATSLDAVIPLQRYKLRTNNKLRQRFLNKHGWTTDMKKKFHFIHESQGDRAERDLSYIEVL